MRISSQGQKGFGQVLADINYFTATGETIETKDWKPRLLGDANE